MKKQKNMLDGKNSRRIEYLEEERQKLWERLLELEKRVAEKPSDLEREAKQASKKAAEYRNRTEDRLKQAEEIYSKITSIETEIQEKLVEIKSKHLNSVELNNELLENSTSLSELVARISEVLKEHPDIEQEIEQLDTLINKIEENSSKANITYKGILTKKTELDEFHREILGYEDEDEDGEIIIVEGLKKELETSYNNLAVSAEKLEEDLESLKNSSKVQYDHFIKNNQDDLDKIKSHSKNEYDKINKQIESLLPNALTAGLSSAFVTKKGEEEELYKEYKTSFNNGILYISLSALLPIGISIFYLLSGATLTDTIERAPKIMLAFLPLYIPLIWTTISANKKVNLSKRLIEEYSHKQVLSMTIEGLSKQIENIEDADMSEELRIKLLNSFLNVTNENPGKLILNYQKSDNPILNFFDRDKKKDNTIVDTLKERTKGIIEKATDEIEDGILNNGQGS
ncbi:hypothetical protein SAMN05192545_1476 [Maribacter dokdonensis]|uniref:Uncharacterized protein n=1 Tax=Maribacter dokdonensis TaxID=320912 RepID=A0ABY0UD56_9FLAO|nr:hypothetical protein [Maribacter dokdonensis]SDS48043.1 hypothetical protein SAMN05192545_1476 [Maribacter dokdonensis]